jgi:hypothetical protein
MEKYFTTRQVAEMLNFSVLTARTFSTLAMSLADWFC